MLLLMVSISSSNASTTPSIRLFIVSDVSCSSSFVASPEIIAQLAANGQIATQYVDLNGVPTMDVDFNPNGSVWAIEGITSPDGRVLGKMGHTERYESDLTKNIPGNKYQKIFESGVAYFK